MAAHDLSIRKANPNDAAVFYAWDEKPHVKQAVSNSGETSFDSEWEEELAERDDGTEFFIALVDHHPIGALEIINPITESSGYWGAVADHQRAIDIWIGDEAYLGKGYGTYMMTFAIEHCFRQSDVQAILIDPLANNTDAHRFYQRLGFKFMERRQFDEESDCYVHKLVRKDWQAPVTPPVAVEG